MRRQLIRKKDEGEKKKLKGKGWERRENKSRDARMESMRSQLMGEKIEETRTQLKERKDGEEEKRRR